MPGLPQCAAFAVAVTVAVTVTVTVAVAVTVAAVASAAGANANSLRDGRPLAPANSRTLAPAHGARVLLPRAPGSSEPEPGQSSELNDVVCVKASRCWAVGYYENSSGAELNQVQRFNGRRWSRISTPDPGGTASGDRSELFGLACISVSDCWAVGEWVNSRGADVNEALRFNGQKWSLVRTRDPASNSAGDFNSLRAVACAKVSDCWAVGYTQSGSGAAYLNEALRWSGRRWSVVKTPNRAGSALGDENFLFGLACASSTACWAVGYTQSGSSAADLNEALRWNGKKWSVVKTPNPKGDSPHHFNQLDGVTCVSTSDCWGVGFTGDSSGFLNEALHFNGKRWSHFKTPQPGTSLSELGNPLVGVACTGANDCWGVGYYFNNSGTAILNEALRFNGKRWSHVRTPQPAGTHKDLNTLSGVACPSASDCRAVGSVYPHSASPVNEALHWNGKHWTGG